jgi:diguanylate cyclase (GGDEF)-like protein
MSGKGFALLERLAPKGRWRPFGRDSASQNVVATHRLNTADAPERCAVAAAPGGDGAELAAVVEHLPYGLLVLSQDFRLIVRNRLYVEMLRLSEQVVRPGISLRDLIDHGAATWLHAHVSPDAAYAELMELFSRGKSAVSKDALADGRIIETSYQPMASGGWMAIYQDVTDREHYLATVQRRDTELSLQNLHFDAALDNMSHGITMYDADEKLTVINRRYFELVGIPPEKMRVGMSFHDVAVAFAEAGFFPEQSVDDVYYSRLKRKISGQGQRHVEQLPSGIILASRHQPLPNGGWVSVFEDVTDIHEAESRMMHMAHHDALTGLPNRVLFRQKLEEALARARRGSMFAVLCLDLDHFKAVNDTLGHPIGDELLRAVTDRLRAELRETDTVARLSGDEFAILQTSVNQPHDATALARRLVAVLSAPYQLSGHSVIVGASIGIAVVPTDGTDPDTLLKNADLALYKAKANGRAGHCFFAPELDANMQARRILELDLRRALDAEEFELHYQPLVDIASSAIIGFEALLRWRHPVRGQVSPADFVPLAEEIGLIVPLGEWVLRRACAEAANLPDHLKVAVNLSPAQFRRPGLIDVVVSALNAAGLPARRLELEITETLILQETEETLTTLHELRRLGVSIAMDDFGTGYSSISMLRRFPFDRVKIDRSFVADVVREGGSSAAIVRAVASLCAALGIGTTVEGVETEDQLAWLRAEGLGNAQGYLFGRPLPPSELQSLLGRREVHNGSNCAPVKIRGQRTP